MTSEYLLLFHWTIAALGAALFLGTGAAFLRFRRTGALPGEAADGSPSPRDATTPGRRIVVRCLLGLTLVVVGALGVSGQT